jgi:hypothetical protein
MIGARVLHAQLDHVIGRFVAERVVPHDAQQDLGRNQRDDGRNHHAQNFQ